MFPSWSCYYKIPRNYLCCSEIIELTALLFFVTWIPLRIILALTEYPLIPSWFKYFTKVFKISFDLPKIFRSLLLLKFLLTSIMINPISLIILLASFVIIILSPLIQYVANARNPQSDPRIHPSGSDIIFNMGWISTNQIVIDCTPKPTQLIHPWSERCFWPPDLEIIILLHLNFELVSCFYNQISLHSSSSGWVPMLTSDPLWTIGSFVGFYPTVSFILNNLVSLSMGI